MQPLGSPQGSHDAPAHLFGVQRRVQHSAALSLPVALLLLFLLLLKRPDDGGSGGAKRRRRRASVRQRERVREHHPAQGERGSASEASTHCRQPSACVRVCVCAVRKIVPPPPPVWLSQSSEHQAVEPLCVCVSMQVCVHDPMSLKSITFTH